MNGETNPKIRETEEQNPTACDLRLVGYSSAVMTNTNTKHAPEAHWPIRKNTKTPIVFFKKKKISENWRLIEKWETYWFRNKSYNQAANS